MTKYVIKPTKHGWYFAVGHTWHGWSFKDGWFDPLDIMWCLSIGEYNNPHYVHLSILGFNIEIGKFEKKAK